MSGPSVRFTELMTGHVDFAERDPERAAAAGRTAEHRLTLRLTVVIDDLDRFAADPNRAAGIVGWVEWDALGGRLPIARGTFNLLVGTAGTERKRMRYRLSFHDGVGHPVTLLGEKRIGPPGLRLWPDTTTLYLRAVRGRATDDDDGAELVASGILRLRPLAFARQLTTFHATGPSRIAQIAAIARFDLLFARQLWLAYGPPIGRRVRAALPAPVAGRPWSAALRRMPEQPPTDARRVGGPR